ncbi:hypothetical protein BJ508DRAFT_302193 [Ascobolus immersus RN42]|uniref:F-box domain-containing protein n=1 Tax=Ascobolus immersus RN42 TaxID=1160509 RepID=A0A3N4IJH1_ASCIM|nr:hypothetical protein BJ508DRAFT_302193 [Ascobolus immersus RN42]
MWNHGLLQSVISAGQGKASYLPNNHNNHETQSPTPTIDASVHNITMLSTLSTQERFHAPEGSMTSAMAHLLLPIKTTDRSLASVGSSSQAITFLQLPKEHRVAIYGHCDLQTLFSLSLTCSRLHMEINNDPGLMHSILQRFKQTFGLKNILTTTSDETHQPSQKSAFCSLPVEIRLEVYGRCSALTLLQLAHTSSRLHNELIEYPTIFRSSFGYNKLRASRYSNQALAISSIGRLGAWEEYELFQKKYCTRKTTGAAYACPDCLYIRLFDERRRRRSRGGILSSIARDLRHTCFGCMMEIEGSPFNPPDINQQWINGV